MTITSFKCRKCHRNDWRRMEWGWLCQGCGFSLDFQHEPNFDEMIRKKELMPVITETACRTGTHPFVIFIYFGVAGPFAGKYIGLSKARYYAFYPYDSLAACRQAVDAFLRGERIRRGPYNKTVATS